MSTSPTIQSVIDLALAATPYDPAHDTVDTVKTGDPNQPLKGIATTFLASCDVIQRAAAAGANLIITHEPIFYNHLDETDWLQNDPVYQAKRSLIEEHNLVIWRFHDYWHAHHPDGIMVGVIRALGWEDYVDPASPDVYSLPSLTLADLIAQLKQRLGIGQVRMVGDPAMICRHASLMVGSPGGRWQIHALGQPGVDVVICGEINEWEISEYVRDAIHQGAAKALVVIGHEPSEEAGMAYLADWLRERVPGVPITHIPTGNALRFA